MENNERYIYRGVSEEMHQTGKGLQPKGTSFYRINHFDEGLNFDMGCTFDGSTNNAVIVHQHDSKKFPTSGVSTTPFLERAKVYATNKGKRLSGIVYKIDRALLKEKGVTEHKVKDYAKFPTIPEDDEIILVSNDNAVLPQGIVIETIIVKSN
jgi:hypothetical protein